MWEGMSGPEPGPLAPAWSSPCAPGDLTGRGPRCSGALPVALSMAPSVSLVSDVFDCKRGPGRHHCTGGLSHRCIRNLQVTS